jgi:RNA polymerase-binding transcription factor DksA
MALVTSLYDIARETPSRTVNNSALSPYLDDAGTDSYDREFALSLLAEGGNALLEIDEALSRIDRGTYGVCEMSGGRISTFRLRAAPFTRFTVECEAKSYRPLGEHFAWSPFSVADEIQVEEEEENNTGDVE